MIPTRPGVLDKGIIRGVIHAVQVGHVQAVSYQVVWWNGNIRQEAWLNEAEVTPVVTTTRQRIGFGVPDPERESRLASIDSEPRRTADHGNRR